MKKIFKIALFSILCVLIVEWSIVLLEKKDFVVLVTKGWIAHEEKSLIIISLLLMCIVVVPAIAMTIFFSWKYREGKGAKYTPNWDNSHIAEAIWWGVPFLIIIVLSVITWRSSHQLDPFKPLEHEKKPMVIQAVALQWKWLFLYPEQGIATVNYVEFPEKTPIAFEITSDAPMNSFWIPQLGGQIYAMPGMKTKIHLIADETGVFRGSSANLSGEGFAGMKFDAIAVNQGEFDRWAASIQTVPKELTEDVYKELAKPSSYNPKDEYTVKDSEMFDKIAMKPMMSSPKKAIEGK